MIESYYTCPDCEWHGRWPVKSPRVGHWVECPDCGTDVDITLIDTGDSTPRVAL